jgi:hypothetical protein
MLIVAAVGIGCLGVASIVSAGPLCRALVEHPQLAELVGISEEQMGKIREMQESTEQDLRLRQILNADQMEQVRRVVGGVAWMRGGPGGHEGPGGPGGREARQELRRDARELRCGRRQLGEDIRELRHDRQELRHDLRELRRDRREFRHDAMRMRGARRSYRC